MRLYNFVDFIVHQQFFPQENKYAIYIKVNGHLEMTKKVPYINIGAKINISRETPNKPTDGKSLVHITLPEWLHKLLECLKRYRVSTTTHCTFNVSNVHKIHQMCYRLSITSLTSLP